MHPVLGVLQELSDLLFLLLEAIYLHYINVHTSEDGERVVESVSAQPMHRSSLLNWFREFSYPQREQESDLLRRYGLPLCSAT